MVSLGSLGVARGQSEIINLAIGDAERRGQRLSVGIDGVIDTRTGETVSPQTAVERMTGTRLILVAEQHTDLEFHRVQLRVLELLQRQDRALMIGLEMFPADHQDVLDAWIAGEFTEAAFVEASDWYRVWGYNWGYYREIFLFARRYAIPLIALNEPREGAESDDGTSGLDPDLASDDHRTLFRVFFESDTPVHGGLTDEQWERLFAAQCAMDAAMAFRAAEALTERPENTLVVLAGSGHVVYELGIARQIRRWYDGPATTIVPVEIANRRARFRASVADFVWGVPEPAYPAFPELGAVTISIDGGLHVIHVEPESPADLGGLEAGDTLHRFDGATIRDKRDLNRSLAGLRWGDEAMLGVERDGEARDLELSFRRLEN